MITVFSGTWACSVTATPSTAYVYGAPRLSSGTESCTTIGCKPGAGTPVYPIIARGHGSPKLNTSAKKVTEVRTGVHHPGAGQKISTCVESCATIAYKLSARASVNPRMACGHGSPKLSISAKKVTEINNGATILEPGKSRARYLLGGTGRLSIRVRVER